MNPNDKARGPTQSGALGVVARGILASQLNTWLTSPMLLSAKSTRNAWTSSTAAKLAGPARACLRFSPHGHYQRFWNAICSLRSDHAFSPGVPSCADNCTVPRRNPTEPLRERRSVAPSISSSETVNPSRFSLRYEVASAFSASTQPHAVSRQSPVLGFRRPIRTPLASARRGDVVKCENAPPRLFGKGL